MVSFGVSSMFFHEFTCSEIFSLAEQANLDALEFWIETPSFWLRGLPVPEVVACRREHPGIRVTVHSPILDLNPCSLNPDVADLSVGYAVRAITITEKIGAKMLTVHPGRRTARRPPGAVDFKRFARYLDELRIAVQGKDFQIAMENMEPLVNSLISTPERMRTVLDENPWLFFTLDTSHALIKSEEEAMRYISLCGDRLVNVHMSRVEGKTLHRPLDRSQVICRLLAELKEQHFDGSLMLEIDDLTFNRPLSREEKIGIIARDSTFMRECMA